jgi:SnoaL-like domain
MPARQTVEALAAAIEAGRYVEAIEEFYTEDASMRENMGDKRVGRAVLAAGEKGVMERFASIAAERIGPALIEGDLVASRWRFTFTARSGTVTTLEEIAWQRWQGEKVAEESFFYDPAQIAPRPA